MNSMKFLFFIWIPLANAVTNPTRNVISKMDQSPDIFYLNVYDKVCPGHCESGWTYFDETNACYKTFFDATAYDAEHLCRTLGGHLTSIHSYAENIFVAELARMGRKFHNDHELAWIGLWAEGTGSRKWTWSDGTKVDYLAWAVNPQADDDQRCVLLYTDHRSVEPPQRDVTYQKWGDWFCTEKERAFVCKKRALH